MVLPSQRATVLKKQREDLASVVNDASRHVTVRGGQVRVPLKYDDDGNPVKRIEAKYLKILTLADLRFLKAWKESDWNLEKATKQTGVSDHRAKYLAHKLQVFREEEAITRSLAEIPTPEWIASKHVENVFDGGELEDSQQKSLQELAKIQGAYKNTATFSIQQNVFNLPKFTPEVEAKFRELAEKSLDTEAA